LLVDPAFQNQGVGAELLRQVECHSPTVKRFELFTGFKSEKSLHLYKKLGYKEFKTGKDKDNITLIYLEKLK
jgi:RimJ/RimL family protein N-acetyltransferase